jgi:hypothetical protein
MPYEEASIYLQFRRRAASNVRQPARLRPARHAEAADWRGHEHCPIAFRRGTFESQAVVRARRLAYCPDCIATALGRQGGGCASSTMRRGLHREAAGFFAR